MQQLPYNITLSEIFRVFKRKLEDELYEDAAEYFREATDTINDGQIWFRMFKGDNLAWTVRNVLTDAALPTSHSNYQYLMECMESAIAEPQHVEVYADK